MHPSDPSGPNPRTSKPYSACDDIADSYNTLNLTTKHTVEPYGGKKYTWIDEEPSFQVNCTCNRSTLVMEY
ncbi:MAG: hypothetical protein H0U49_06170 [Parachlamydiaceae bacterium]|nr:hypothetical protein [Parachlamydiaceae bacterium]